MDQGEVTALTLLELSAAFDTIDHATLTNGLSDWYGISGRAQIWFSSYLKNSPQSSTGLCAGTSAFYFIHYTTQRYHL